MRLTKKELVIVSVFVAILCVAACWLFYSRLSKMDSGSEQTYGIPIAYEGDVPVYNADAFGAEALKTAEAYAKAHSLTILATQAVELVEDGNPQRAVMVDFRGDAPGVHCFADGHCRPSRAW